MDKRITIFTKIIFFMIIFFLTSQCQEKHSINKVKSSNPTVFLKNNATISPPIRVTEEAGHKVIEEDGEIQMLSETDEANPLHLTKADFVLKEVNGKGRIYNSQPIDEALSLLGKPKKITERRKDPDKIDKEDTIIYEFVGIRLEIGRGWSQVDWFFYNDNSKYLFETPRGISLGDKKEKVIELYGNGKEFPVDEENNLPERIVYWTTLILDNDNPVPFFLSFEFTNNVVSEIGVYWAI